jgi:hypothetical protein
MRGELYVPGEDQDRAKKIHNIFESTISSLPLEDCQLRHNAVSGILEFAAPEGRAFKASGRSSQNKAVEGFVGQALTIKVNGYPYGHPVSRVWLDPEREPSVDIIVIGDAQAAIWPSEGEYFDEANRRIYKYDIPHGSIEVGYSGEEFDYKQTKIELIDYAREQEVVLVERSETWDKYRRKIWYPEFGPGTDDYKEVFKATARGPVSDEEIESMVRDLMLKRRLKGLPFTDDPLREVRLMQGEVNLDEKVEAVQREISMPVARTTNEDEEMERKAHNERLKASFAQRLRGKLFMVTGQISVSEAVAQYAHPRWLQDALDDYMQDVEIEF